MRHNAEAMIREFAAVYRREKATRWAWEKAKQLPLRSSREKENRLLHEELHEVWAVAARSRDDVLFRMEEHCRGPRPDERILTVMAARHTVALRAAECAKINRKLTALRIRNKGIADVEIHSERSAAQAFKKAQRDANKAESELAESVSRKEA